MAEIISMAEWSRRKFSEKAERLFDAMNLNDTLIARILGVAATPGTPESDADPRNPASKNEQRLPPDGTEK